MLEESAICPNCDYKGMKKLNKQNKNIEHFFDGIQWCLMSIVDILNWYLPRQKAHLCVVCLFETNRI